jgi:hypothetical protein
VLEEFDELLGQAGRLTSLLESGSGCPRRRNPPEISACCSAKPGRRDFGLISPATRSFRPWRRLRFAPGFWAFTFSWCAVVILALHWIELEHPAGQRPLAWLAGGDVTALVGGIALRTLLAAGRGELVPRPAPAPERHDAPSLTSVGVAQLGAAMSAWERIAMSDRPRICTARRSAPSAPQFAE